MLAKDTSLRNSMREELQVCPYPLIKHYYSILAQWFSISFASGSTQDFTLDIMWHQNCLLYKIRFLFYLFQTRLKMFLFFKCI